MFHHSLSRTCVTRNGLISLDTQANVFVNGIFCVKFPICKQDMQCASEKNSNVEIKQAC